MLNPNDTYNLNQLNSPYANVIAIAKRARQISEEAEENHEIISEKPLKLAIAEFIGDKYRVNKINVEED
ncbi:MAG: DNA-directed RNA polymerase subunit omega [Oscillospiraceae bacterium]|nr:DNA-directed RNA polymerase subunit omega [Oscillospiraceae bacterium]